MTDDTPDDGAPRPRSRPAPRPRSGAPRPSPRPRLAGSRRAEDAAEPADPTTPRRRPTPAPRPRPTGATSSTRAGARAAATTATESTGRAAGRRDRPARAAADRADTRRRGPALVVVLLVLCVLTAAGGGWLFWQRLHPTSVDAAIFAAARAGVADVYAYDYRDSDGSVQRKLDALTGDLREQYEADLTQGGIIDTAEQVSGTTRFDVDEVALQQVNDAQDQATLVVFGRYVLRSVNSGTQAAPAGSGCTVTDDGAQSCTYAVRVTVLQVDDEWKISELTLLSNG